MGGGGGGYIPRRSDVNQLVRRVREAEADAAFESEVADYLAGQLSEFNDRDVEGINNLLEKVTHELGDEIEGRVDLVFGGSVSKHTYVDGLSDVDALVLLPSEGTADKSPAELRSMFAQRLAARFGSDQVHEGVLSVTLNVGGHEVQLLPARRVGEHYEIASTDGATWSKIRPRRFADALTEANQRLDRKLVPTIKLAKAVIAGLPEQRQISGYHTEALAVDLLSSYRGPRTPKAMLSHFFENAGRLVRSPLQDITGQSTHLDDYLGPAESVQRRVVADSMDRIYRRMQNADGARSISRWRELLEGPSEIQ